MALTLSALTTYAALLDACQRGARVARLTDHGDVIVGTARAFTAPDGSFVRGDADVTTAHVRVTWTTGLDTYAPVADVVAEYDAGTFVLDY